MATPATIDDFLDLVRKSNQIDSDRLDAYVRQRRAEDTLPPDPKKFAALLVREGLLTNFQAEQLLQGRYKGFNVGGYRIIERLGAGGTGTVYLAEHEVMKRRVALKVVPPSVASDPGILERFRREAQAAAVLDHPNIVRAYDFRQEGQLHVLVMEYVNGPSLEQVLQNGGPLSVPVACEYLRQTAIGLDHAHAQGLIHRDVKPANLLVDPTGVVKILDMGLARFAPDGEESVTKKFDENTVMGTADYLAPEQAINLHNVDARADVYSLGATAYALLAGTPPFLEGTVTQKLLWHQMRDPVPLHERRSDVPREVSRIVAKMMAKDPAARFQSCEEIADALAPFCATTPTPQGPARPGAANGKHSASYVRTGSLSSNTLNRKKSGNSTTRKNKQTVTMASPAPPPPRDEEDDYDRPRRRRDPEPRRPVAVASEGSTFGIIALTGIICTVLLLIGGVIAFLVFGPAPTVSSSTLEDENAKPVSPAAVVPPQPITPDPIPGASPTGVHYRQESAHAKGITGITFAPDGARLVTADQDGVIKVWDILNRKPMRSLMGHTASCNSIRFHPRANKLLSAASDTTVRLWDLTTNQHPKPFIHQKPRMLSAVFGRTENDVITGGEDNIVRLWNVAQGKSTTPMFGHKAPISGLAYRTGDDKRNQVVSASHDQTLKLWDLNTGKEIRTLSGHTGICTSVSITHDGKFALSGSHDGTIRKWDLDTGAQVQLLNENQGPVASVAISPDGKRAISAGIDRKVRLWNLVTGKIEQTFLGHTNEITGVCFSPDGRYVASGSLDRSFVVWNAPPQR